MFPMPTCPWRYGQIDELNTRCWVIHAWLLQVCRTYQQLCQTFRDHLQYDCDGTSDHACTYHTWDTGDIRTFPLLTVYKGINQLLLHSCRLIDWVVVVEALL